MSSSSGSTAAPVPAHIDILKTCIQELRLPGDQAFVGTRVVREEYELLFKKDFTPVNGNYQAIRAAIIESIFVPWVMVATAASSANRGPLASRIAAQYLLLFKP